jgi:hypothetical protein
MRPAALRAARLLGCVCTFALVFGELNREEHKAGKPK